MAHNYRRTKRIIPTGRGWIRTNEGISHQIYSLTRLATSVHARALLRHSLGMGRPCVHAGT